MAAERDEPFEAVFQSHFDVVLRFASARTESDVARDVTAETFLAAWQAKDRLPAEPKAWLLAVARRKIADHYREASRRDDLRAAVATLDSGSSPDHADGLAESDHVRAAFARLRPDDRELLQLLAWDGLSRAQAAVVLGCSPALFAVRLHRARRRLRLALDQQALDQQAAPAPLRRTELIAGETS